MFTYSHEENTSAFVLEDDVPEEVKQARVEEIMELQSQIFLEKNQAKNWKNFQELNFDRKEGNYFVEEWMTTLDVDNTVLVE